MNLNFEEFSSLMIKKIWIEASLISNTTDALETKHDRRNTFAKSNKVTFDPITLLQRMLVVQRKTMQIFISNDTINHKIYPLTFLINNEKFALRRTFHLYQANFITKLTYMYIPVRNIISVLILMM